MVCSNNEYINSEEVCSALISMFARIGLDPTLDTGPSSVQVPKRNSGTADMYLMGWANEPTLDAYSLLVQVLHTKEGEAGVANRGGWSYPELDAMVAAAALEPDRRRKRLEIESNALEFRAGARKIMLPLFPASRWPGDERQDCRHSRLEPTTRRAAWLTRMAE